MARVETEGGKLLREIRKDLTEVELEAQVKHPDIPNFEMIFHYLDQIKRRLPQLRAYYQLQEGQSE